MIDKISKTKRWFFEKIKLTNLQVVQLRKKKTTTKMNNERDIPLTFQILKGLQGNTMSNCLPTYSITLDEVKNSWKIKLPKLMEKKQKS